MPHLIKSVRNTLLKNDNFIGNYRVSWRDIINVYNLDKQSNTAKTLLKIIDQHVNPNTFEKMREKYATQIFNHRVAAAIILRQLFN